MVAAVAVVTVATDMFAAVVISLTSTLSKVGGGKKQEGGEERVRG
jgi:hypothetical protein